MNNEEKILSILVQMQADVTGLMQGQSKLESELADVKTDVSNIKTDVSNIKTDVSNIKTDVSSLKTDISNIKTDVSNLQETLSDVKHHVILIEEDNKVNHGALHDEYKQVYDILTNEIRPDITDMKARQENQELHIKWFDSREKKKSS